MLGPELAQFLRSDWRTNRYFAGVFPCDRLPRGSFGREDWPCCLVINTDSATEGGEHWVGVYIDAWGEGIYFDSYGWEPIDPRIIDFLERSTRTWYCNTQTIQSPWSEKCAYFCLYFLTKAAQGWSLRRILRPFDPVRRFQNDIRVTQWFHRQYKTGFHRASRRRLCQQNGVLCFRR